MAYGRIWTARTRGSSARRGGRAAICCASIPHCADRPLVRIVCTPLGDPCTPGTGAPVLFLPDISQILAAEGEHVRWGQVLGRLNPIPLRDAVAQPEAQLGQAEAQESNATTKYERAHRVGMATLRRLPGDPQRPSMSTGRSRPVPKLERDDYERSREVGTERVKALQGRVAAVDGRS